MAGGKEKPITRKKLILAIVLSIVLSAFVTGMIVWLATGGYAAFMPQVVATLSQDESEYGEAEKSALAASESFWTAMENADEDGMRSIAHEDCVFVHMGVTADLDGEIAAFASGIFKPTEIVFHGKNVDVFDDTAVVLTDCDYSLKLGGMPTTHHFAVTEVYILRDGAWKLVRFSFTALVS